MGRLTLNIPLSFTQFEREVIGERVRNKIAASKKMGMWMGGVTPIGYATKDRKLVIVPEEADPFGGRDDVLGGQQPIRFDGC
jgi:site-specific DNA recombinase